MRAEFILQFSPSVISSRSAHMPKTGQSRTDLGRLGEGSTSAEILTSVPSASFTAAVQLHYRRINQAERWQSVEMRPEGRSFQASIPGPYTLLA
jgi:hypothetical protein